MGGQIHPETAGFTSEIQRPEIQTLIDAFGGANACPIALWGVRSKRRPVLGVAIFIGIPDPFDGQMWWTPALRRRLASSDGPRNPDPLLWEILQEFLIKQGVGGSPSRPAAGSVPEKWYNGARIRPGLRMVRNGNMGEQGRGYQTVDGITRVGEEIPGGVHEGWQDNGSRGAVPGRRSGGDHG